MSTPDSSSPRLRLALVSAGLFTVLAALALTINSAGLTSLDRSVWTWFDVHQTPGWHVDSDGAFSYLGKPFHVAAAGVVCGALLSWRARSVIPAVLIIGSVGTGVIIEQALKATVDRTADVAAMYPDYYHHTFPSGHVTGSVALLGTIAVCLGAGLSRAWKATLAGLVVVGVVTVALLALYSYAHTFTDVLGGLALGGGIVAAGAAFLATSTRRGAADTSRVEVVPRLSSAI